MDFSPAIGWTAPDGWRRISVIDVHTGGEPFRIVIDGLPDIPGDDVLARRRYAEHHLDELRKLLMWEPRGHADMYGGWIGSPTRNGSDFAVLFTHNAGFSTMCGHGIIALTKVALSVGLVAVVAPETTLRIDTPAGQIESTARTVGGQVDRIRFKNVPSYVDRLDQVVHVAGIGEVKYDLAFGGAFYAYVDAASVGIDWPPSGQDQLIDRGRRIKEAISSSRPILHPEHPDLGFLYGVIFSGPATGDENNARNVCVFADGEIDRSPTGTGVSGRIAIEAARGNLTPGESIRVESIVGTVFTGSLAAKCEYGGFPAVVPEIGGSAHITGKTDFYVDPTDDLTPGFLIR